MKKTIDISDKTGEFEIILDKKGMELEIVGRFQTRGAEVKELNIRIVHRAPNTTANTTLNGVAWDASKLRLSGTIVIEKLAQQTQSFLRESILLLSPTAKAEAVPNLEILANDVKCSHAATISNISDEQVFYLMSRGISKQQAEELIFD